MKPLPLFSVFVLSSCASVLTATEPPHTWPPDAFLPVTAARIAALSDDIRPAWQAYWDASEALRAAVPPRQAAEFSPLQTLPGAPKGSRHTKGLLFDAAREWYAGAEARTVADRVVEHQTAAGGWTKGIDYTRPRGEPTAEDTDIWSEGTFDNDATIAELRFLALVIDASDDPPSARHWMEAFGRGMHYVFAAQYPNGGFPQIYPLAGSYHDAVTFNDDAMGRILGFLRDVGAGEYAWVADEIRVEARAGMLRGIACILATQLKGADGRPGGWCQQYDAITLQPCAARNFEPIATSAGESASLALYLMSLRDPSPEIRGAVDGVMAWFERVAIADLKWNRFSDDAQLLPAPGGPSIWARMYEVGTDKPIFGDRDRTIHYAVGELSYERRAGYGWYGDWPAEALARYALWKGRGSPEK